MLGTRPADLPPTSPWTKGDVPQGPTSPDGPTIGTKPVDAAPTLDPAPLGGFDASGQPAQGGITGYQPTLQQLPPAAPAPNPPVKLPPGVQPSDFASIIANNTPLKTADVKQLTPELFAQLSSKQVMDIPMIDLMNMPAGIYPDLYKARLGDIVETDFHLFAQRAADNVHRNGGDALMKNLSVDEKGSILAYTSEWYGYMNTALRTGTGKPAAIEMNKKLTAALDKLPVYKSPSGQRLMRGTNFLPPETLANLKPGGIYTDKAFTSTSATKPFTGKYQFKIKGKTGRDVASVSDFPEGEVLFKPSTEFRITKVKPNKDGGTDIYMTEIVPKKKGWKPW
jgi:hypothetical protein